MASFNRLAALGAFTALASCFVHAPAIAGEIWVRWASLVLFPLAFAALRTRDERAVAAAAWDLAGRVLWWAIPVLGVSFCLEQGVAAALFALPWCIVAFGVAALGGVRLLAQGLTHWHRCLADIACIHVGGAAVWLLFQRVNWNLLGFEEPWVTWTAAHFLVDACLLFVVVSHFGKAWPERPRFRWLAISLAAGFWLTALGIQFSSNIERVGAWLMAASAIWAAGELLLQRRTPLSRANRFALDVAALSLVAGIALAIAYTLSLIFEWSWPSLSFMAFYHAGLNTAGFATVALLVATRPSAMPKRDRSTVD